MAGEQSPGTVGTPSPAAAGAPGTPIGAQPASPPAGPGATGAPPAPARVISEEVLPEPLRGKSPQELKFILGRMATSIESQAQRIRELEQSPPPGVSRATPAEPAVPSRPAEPSKPLEERILEDAEGTIAEIVQKLVGPTASRLESTVEEVLESTAAQDYDDWPDVKDDVFKLLRDAAAPKTKANIKMAYTQVIGERTLAARRLVAAAAGNPDLPREAPPVQQLQEPTGLEGEIFRASGMSLEDWHKMGDSANLDIRVPTNKKKEA